MNILHTKSYHTYTYVLIYKVTQGTYKYTIYNVVRYCLYTAHFIPPGISLPTEHLITHRARGHTHEAYTRSDTHTKVYTQGTYTWGIHTEQHIHKSIRISNIHTVYTHRAAYTPSDVHTEQRTHRATYTRNNVHMERHTHGDIQTTQKRNTYRATYI